MKAHSDFNVFVEVHKTYENMIDEWVVIVNGKKNYFSSKKAADEFYTKIVEEFLSADTSYRSAKMSLKN